jgi:NAD(P)-dependent dehydrogenase (short-subunit alcohol dehydrogenase family)
MNFTGSDWTAKGKRVLVTGAATGVGKGIALEFGRRGASVVVHFSSDSEEPDLVVDEVRKGGGRALAVKADFSDPDETKQLASKAVEFLGGIDILVNNAGVTLTKPFDEVTLEDFTFIYNVNVRGMFFVTQGCLPSMVKQGDGVVINISSVHYNTGLPEHTVYAGTKGAIVSFTRTLSLEVVKKGIRVFGIAPGWILVEKHIETMPEGFDLKAAEALIPAGFIARPQNVGRLAVFLSSPDAAYMVGHTIPFDGGQSTIQPLADRITELYEGKLPSKKV